MVGVPLVVGDELLGVMHVGRIEDRSFEQHDVELLQVAGERISSAVQTRRLAIESAAGAVLERELLPTRLPNLPGLEFAARYAPAEDRSIGGDWYDAFVLPSGDAVDRHRRRRRSRAALGGGRQSRQERAALVRAAR